jgi:hypothetical protein
VKALVCVKCLDIRALDPKGAWTACRCGNCEARWLDPDKGTVRVKALDQLAVRILGLNNHYLINGARGPTHMAMVEAGGQWEWWRKLHDEATNAPAYIFDKSRRSCWATIVKVGETNDITWEPDSTEKPAS